MAFPRTHIGDVSVSRLIIGTNWFLGFSHTSAAKDRQIKATMTADRIADIIEVFLNEGVDAVLGLSQAPALHEGIRQAEQRTGRKCIVISTPGINIGTTGPRGRRRKRRSTKRPSWARPSACPTSS